MSIESSLCNYSHVYSLVTGNITVTCAISAAGNNHIQRNQPFAAATQATITNCAPCKICKTEINNTFVDEGEELHIVMPIYNVIEYNDNYPDTSGSLWQFKRDEIENNANASHDNNALSFKYKLNTVRIFE